MTRLERAGVFSTEQISQIEADDDAEIAACSDAEKYYNQVERLNVFKSIREFREENKEFYEECRIRYMVGEKIRLEELLGRYRDAIEKEKSSVRKIGLANGMEKAEKEWKKVVANLDYFTGRREGISEDMITQAREVPLQNILEVNQMGFARCVSGNHEDKNPSMYCKKGFAYCFSCSWTSDPIGVVMARDGVNFPEAVRRLCGM